MTPAYLLLLIFVGIVCGVIGYVVGILDTDEDAM